MIPFCLAESLLSFSFSLYQSFRSRQTVPVSPAKLKLNVSQSCRGNPGRRELSPPPLFVPLSSTPAGTEPPRVKIATLEGRSRERRRRREEKKGKGKERKGKKREKKKMEEQRLPRYTLASRAGILERDRTRDTHALPKS